MRGVLEERSRGGEEGRRGGEDRTTTIGREVERWRGRGVERRGE